MNGKTEARKSAVTETAKCPAKIERCLGVCLAVMLDLLQTAIAQLVLLRLGGVRRWVVLQNRGCCVEVCH